MNILFLSCAYDLPSEKDTITQIVIEITRKITFCEKKSFYDK